jgi:hypothetical protein
MRAYTTPTGNPPADVERLRQIVAETRGRFFSVLFVSRGRNEARRMLARLKRLPPERLREDRWHSQLTVYDVERRDWRRVPLERVVEFRCGSERWVTGMGHDGR